MSSQAKSGYPFLCTSSSNVFCFVLFRPCFCVFLFLDETSGFAIIIIILLQAFYSFLVTHLYNDTDFLFLF